MDSITNLLNTLLQSAVTAELLGRGLLLSPKAALAAADEATRRDNRMRGWILHGHVHPEMYKLLRQDRPVQFRTLLCYGQQKTPFLIVQNQVADWVHRFLMPIAGPVALEFLKDIPVNGLGTSMATRRERHAVITRMNPTRKLEFSSDHSISLESVDVSQLAFELIDLSTELLKPQAIEADDRAIEHACVTIVVSEEVEILMQTALGNLGKFTH